MGNHPFSIVCQMRSDKKARATNSPVNSHCVVQENICTHPRRVFLEIPGERVVSKVKKQGKHELKPEFPEGFAVGEGIQTNINLLWEVYQYFFEKKAFCFLTFSYVLFLPFLLL